MFRDDPALAILKIRNYFLTPQKLCHKRKTEDYMYTQSYEDI